MKLKLFVKWDTRKRGFSRSSGIGVFVLSLDILVPRVVRFMDKSTPSPLVLCLPHLSSFSNDILAHFSMSSIHRIFGLPCFLAPRTVPCMISVSRQRSCRALFCFFLIIWPKYDSFLLLIKLVPFYVDKWATSYMEPDQWINQSILFNETKNRLKVPADTTASGTVQWQS